MATCQPITAHLDRLDVLLVDGVQQRVLGLHLELQQQLDHLQVLVVDGHEQRGPAQPITDQYQYCDILTNHSSPAQRVDAVDVDAAAGTLQHSVKNILAVEKIF